MPQAIDGGVQRKGRGSKDSQAPTVPNVRYAESLASLPPCRASQPSELPCGLLRLQSIGGRSLVPQLD
jgi:hypothetical protein